MTSKTPATRQKIPKRVAAGKAVAERTRQAREAQKRFYPRPRSSLQLISSNKLLPLTHQLWLTPSPFPPLPPPPPAYVEGESTKNVLTTTQWLSVMSIIVSFAGIYYKREEIKGLLTKKTPVVTMPQAPPPSPIDTVPQGGLQYPLQKEKWASVRWIKNRLNFSFFFVTMARKFLFIHS